MFDSQSERILERFISKSLLFIANTKSVGLITKQEKAKIIYNFETELDATEFEEIRNDHDSVFTKRKTFRI